MTTPDVDLTLVLEERFPLAIPEETVWYQGELQEAQRSDMLRRTANELEGRITTYQTQWNRASRSETGPLIRQLQTLIAE